MPKRKKIYCYVDETGQDSGSKFFIVVGVIVIEDLIKVREALLNLEIKSKVRKVKWHKAQRLEREEFLFLSSQAGLSIKVYYGEYSKDVSFISSIAEALYQAIKDLRIEKYEAIICVDGIDGKKSEELTTVLRRSGVKLRHVRTARDESEVLIRLADRWAGCIRLAQKDAECLKLLSQAKKNGIIKQI